MHRQRLLIGRYSTTNPGVLPVLRALSTTGCCPPWRFEQALEPAHRRPASLCGRRCPPQVKVPLFPMVMNTLSCRASPSLSTCLRHSEKSVCQTSLRPNCFAIRGDCTAALILAIFTLMDSSLKKEGTGGSSACTAAVGCVTGCCALAAFTSAGRSASRPGYLFRRCRHPGTGVEYQAQCFMVRRLPKRRIARWVGILQREVKAGRLVPLRCIPAREQSHLRSGLAQHREAAGAPSPHSNVCTDRLPCTCSWPWRSRAQCTWASPITSACTAGSMVQLRWQGCASRPSVPPCRRKWPSTHSRAPPGWGALPSSAVEAGGQPLPVARQGGDQIKPAMSRSPPPTTPAAWPSARALAPGAAPASRRQAAGGPAMPGW